MQQCCKYKHKCNTLARKNFKNCNIVAKNVFLCVVFNKSSRVWDSFFIKI